MLGKPQHPSARSARDMAKSSHEALLSREERATSEDLGGYYRIPADGRDDLNYTKYVEQGESRIQGASDYTSHNTEQLDVAGMAALLHKLDFMRRNRRRRCWRYGRRLMKIGITGARALLVATCNGGCANSKSTRSASSRMTSMTPIDRAAAGPDFVFHLAGVNRPQDPVEFDDGNADFSLRLVSILGSLPGRPAGGLRVVHPGAAGQHLRPASERPKTHCCATAASAVCRSTSTA